MLYNRELFQWLEPTLLLLLVLSALLRPGWLSPLARRGRGVVRSLVARPWRAGLLVSLGAALAAALVALGVGLPVPRVSDETSYLLAADTFARGRVAMPAPPSPEHFETFFVLVRPVYASKYPPGQGLVLAAGEALGGHPAVALWLGTGALCGVVFWALGAWLPARWALVGAVIAGLRFGVAGYWSHSYWGGTVAALGGALVWGATPRLLWAGGPRRRDSLLLGLGVAVLAATRPLEGLVVSLPAAFLLARGAVAARPFWRVVARGVAPAAGVLAATALAMAWYDARLTGDPLKLPHQLWEEQYASIPIFAGQPVRHLDERPLQVRRFFDALAEQYDPAARWIGGTAALRRVGFLADFFLGPALAAAAFLGLVSRSRPGEDLFRTATLPALVVLLLAAVHVVVRPWWPHYTAPATVLLLLPAVAGLRRVRSWRWPGSGAPVGQTLVAGILVVQVLMVGPQLVERLRERGFWSHQRAAVHAELVASAGDDLVFVRYGANHHPAMEWVWNGADLATAPVLWVHDLGRERNRALLESLPSRRAWRLEVDVPGRGPPRPVPYPETVPLGTQEGPARP